MWSYVRLSSINVDLIEKRLIRRESRRAEFPCYFFFVFALIARGPNQRDISHNDNCDPHSHMGSVFHVIFG